MRAIFIVLVAQFGFGMRILVENMWQQEAWAGFGLASFAAILAALVYYLHLLELEKQSKAR